MHNFLEQGKDMAWIADHYHIDIPLTWALCLEGKTNQERFKEELGWGLRTWDYWYFNDLDPRFGDSWSARFRVPEFGNSPESASAGDGGQARADPSTIGRCHTLFYFTQEGDLVFAPMAGGGVVADTCLAFNRKCWSFDLADRPETRPEIEPHQWNPEGLLWPVKGEEKPDLIFFDPPYFKKQENHYPEESISVLSRKQYLKFFKELFPLLREYTKTHARIAFMNADWRDFQGVSARQEDPGQSIFLSDYIHHLKDSGWEITHIIDCPMSTQRFQANIVAQMQKNRTLGIVRRSLIIGRKK